MGRLSALIMGAGSVPEGCDLVAWLLCGGIGGLKWRRLDRVVVTVWLTCQLVCYIPGVPMAGWTLAGLD